MIIDNAKVMAKGQITLPKDIRTALGLGTGDRVTLVYDRDRVIMMNSAVYAMRELQNDMKGEAERAGLVSEEDVNGFISALRSESEE